MCELLDNRKLWQRYGLRGEIAAAHLVGFHFCSLCDREIFRERDVSITGAELTERALSKLGIPCNGGSLQSIRQQSFGVPGLTWHLRSILADPISHVVQFLTDYTDLGAPTILAASRHDPNLPPSISVYLLACQPRNAMIDVLRSSSTTRARKHHPGDLFVQDGSSRRNYNHGRREVTIRGTTGRNGQLR